VKAAHDTPQLNSNDRAPNIPEQFLLRTQILYCARGLSPSQKGLRRNFSTNRAVLPDAFKQAFPREKCL
jgi:hypothetical protein